ncbi:hypothetical protein BDQ12DRAFT_718204 [Crucibulum laeve]|uniref:Uncharacterized protein n=1 Tax=Crucibulum laeve TaxID=68775 RepID=A0A5C3MJK9_9AGAR|nr:hypothetical protein BDQ12DRAFT_718204 [Crucibulum laeve]
MAFLSQTNFSVSGYAFDCRVALLDLEILPFRASALGDDVIPEEEVHTLLGYGTTDHNFLYPFGGMHSVISRPKKAQKVHLIKSWPDARDTVKLAAIEQRIDQRNEARATATSTKKAIPGKTSKISNPVTTSPMPKRQPFGMLQTNIGKLAQHGMSRVPKVTKAATVELRGRAARRPMSIARNQNKV